MNVRDLYDGVADRYDALVARTRYVGPQWLEIQLEKRSGERLEATSILDLGCANGSNGTLLRRAFRSAFIHGIDISPEMTAQAVLRRHCYDLLQVADLNALLPMISDRSHDLVVALGMIEFVADPVALLRDVARVLERGGRLLASFQEHWPERPEDAPRETHSGEVVHHAYSMEEISSMLVESGLEAQHRESLIGYVSGTGFACPYVFVTATRG